MVTSYKRNIPLLNKFNINVYLEEIFDIIHEHHIVIGPSHEGIGPIRGEVKR